MPTKVTNQMPGLEYDKNMVCEDFLNMGMLPLDKYIYIYINMDIYIYIYIYSETVCFLNYLCSFTGGYTDMSEISRVVPMELTSKSARCQISIRLP